jgi:hypothetical protein
VQHVALHEGFISGILIGKIEVLLQEEAQAISKSQLKEQAENIKQLMGKIQKQL